MSCGTCTPGKKARNIRERHEHCYFFIFCMDATFKETLLCVVPCLPEDFPASDKHSGKSYVWETHPFKQAHFCTYSQNNFVLKVIAFLPTTAAPSIWFVALGPNQMFWCKLAWRNQWQSGTEELQTSITYCTHCKASAFLPHRLWYWHMLYSRHNCV